jgi:hypothetical protein
MSGNAVSLSRLIGWLNTLIPVLAVVVGYQIAISQQVAEACMPLLEGCTSISRAVRNGDALFWFRLWMMPLSMLLVFYWVLQYRWLEGLLGSRRRHRVILILGAISALALVLYANFLGSQGDFYRFMRSFGVTFYFAFAGLAQLLSLQSLRTAPEAFIGTALGLLRTLWVLVIAQWLIGLISLSITITQPANKFVLENIVEWNFALAMISFYAISAELWHRRPVKRPGDCR